ncbi:hypothetical protein WJ973_12285 [Achromobacter xylosoxidans]
MAQVALALGRRPPGPVSIRPASSLSCVMVALLVMSCPCARQVDGGAHRHGVGPFGAGAHPSMPDAALTCWRVQACARAEPAWFPGLAFRHDAAAGAGRPGHALLAAITMLVSSLAAAHNSWRLSRRDWSGRAAPGGALEAAP